jgi:hypothetical protein
MIDRQQRLSRRKFLAGAAGLTLSAAAPVSGTSPTASSSGLLARPPRLEIAGRKPLAVVTTVFRPLSHSYHIAGRFLFGYVRQGTFHTPAFYIKGMSVDQTPDNDLSRQWAKEFGFRWSRQPADVLMEGDRLTVDGVLLIAEHGNYPRNEKGQILYPRFEMFQQIVECFRRAGRVVPVFCDKHLSYSWEKAQRMVRQAKEMKIPLMAGSSLPVTWRRPELELPLESRIEEGLVAAYGPIEVYGIHALETLQCMMERRAGGETGVRAVTCLTGDRVWKAGDEGLWSWDLLEAALARSETVNAGDVRRNTGAFPVQSQPALGPIAFLIEYRDGRRGTVLLLNGHVQDFTFAAKIAGESKPASCLFVLPQPPGAKFLEAQTLNIEKMLLTGQPPYPIERTLLTTGMLDFLLTSHSRHGERIETVELDVRYQAPQDSGFVRGSISALPT